MWEFLYELWTTKPDALHLIYVLLGGFIGLFGLVSLFVKERLYLTESLVATLVGIAFGPVGLQFVTPEAWFKEDLYYVLREAARLVVGLQVMAAGVSTPGEFLLKNKLSLSVMLGPVMAVMWAISALSLKIALGLDWPQSLVIAACITPTDPVLAHSVIKGKFAERYIPTRLRNLLAVESGANDGLGFPFMMLPIWFMLSKSSGEALSHWLIHTWLWEIIMSIVVGTACGFAARFLLKASMARRLIDKESFLVFTIALTLFVSGLVALMASDDLFAIFIAGNVFAWDATFAEATADSHITEVIDMIFNITFFVFFGSLIPWRAFVAFGIWKLILAAVLVLLFRRLPIVMLLRNFIPTLQSRKEAFFAGWFGPMGVGAIFFAIQARDIFHSHSDTPIPKEFLDTIFPVVAFVVLSSILIHGITVPLTNSHLKRRMKLKVKRRNKLAARLRDIPVERTLPALTSRTVMEESTASESVLETPVSPIEEEYVYITDDEDADISPLNESPLEDVVVDPSSPDLTPRPRKRQLQSPYTINEDYQDE
jgi:NhaP-type Na+/H+ or K+/H+ antiporter